MGFFTGGQGFCYMHVCMRKRPFKEDASYAFFDENFGGNEVVEVHLTCFSCCFCFKMTKCQVGEKKLGRGFPYKSYQQPQG